MATEASATDTARNRSEQALFTTLLIINAVLYGLINIVLVFIVPVYAAMFADFGAKLPRATQLLIDFSGLLKAWWWLIAPLMVTLIVAISAIYRARRIAPWETLKLVALLQLLLLVAMGVSIALPVMQLNAVANGLK